jgi:O-antigen/teichoic acid export membrane protein
MRGESFLRHALIYGLGSMLVQAASFVLLPLYTRYLVPAEYGSLEVLSRLGDFVVVLLMFGGIRQAALAFHGQSADPAERRRVLGTTVLLVVATALAGGCLMTALAEPMSRVLTSVNPALLRLAVWAIVLDGMNFVLLVGPQARQEPGFFVTVTTTQFFMRLGLSIAFVVGCGWGITGVLLASVLTSAAHAVVLAGHELLLSGRPDWPRLRELTRFAVVFLPSSVAFFLLNYGDRFILSEYGGLAEVGSYGLGYKLALAVVLFSRASLGTVWNARLYEAARAANAPDVFGRVFTRCLAAYLWGGLALCLFQDEVVAVLGGGAYVGAARVIAPVVLAYFFMTAADLMDAAFYISRRPSLKTLVALASTTLTCLLYFALIPPWGATGAALATLGGLAFHAGLTLVVSQGVFPVRYEWRRLVVAMGLAVVLWQLSRSLPLAPWAMALKALGWLALPCLLWVTGFVTAEEKAWVLAIGGKMLARFRLPAEAVVVVPGADECLSEPEA